MRIAYCISVHKNPKQVARLIERIYSPSDYFYIHKDNKTSSHGWESILGKYRNENVLFTSRYKCYWGTFRLVEVTLDGMNYCRSFDYDYFINLSGQCYPIKPLSIIKEELEKKSLAYMEYFKLPSKRWEAERGGLHRINYFHVRFWKREIPSFRFPRLNKSLPCNLEPYGGSAWFCLPKRFVNYILDYVSKHPEITRFYRYSRSPAEMFFQTIVMNSPLKSEVVDDDKRYIRWKNKKPSPEIFREEDFKDIVQSDKLFARKFDINIDKNILDLIDSISLYALHTR